MRFKETCGVIKLLMQESGMTVFPVCMNFLLLALKWNKLFHIVKCTLLIMLGQVMCVLENSQKTGFGKISWVFMLGGLSKVYFSLYSILSEKLLWMILPNKTFPAPWFRTEIAIYCRKNLMFNVVGFSASLLLSLLVHSYAYNFSVNLSQWLRKHKENRKAPRSNLKLLLTA